MARKTARIEGETAPAAKIGGLAAVVEQFKADHPEKWDEIRLCPLQHGLEEMIACLNC